MFVKRIFLIPILLVLSCIVVEEEINLKLDGSGSMNISYTIPETFYKSQQGPMAINEDNILEKLKGKEGVEIESIGSRREGEQNIVVYASIRFNDISKLSDSSFEYKLEDVGDNKEFRLIAKVRTGEIGGDEKVRNTFKQIMSNYVSKLKVKFETDVVETNGKKLKSNVVEWFVPTVSLIGKEDIILWARFKKSKGFLNKIKHFFGF